MGHVIRNGLLLPKREVINRKRAHIRVPRVNIILRRPFFPALRPLVGAVALDAKSTAAILGSSILGTTGLSGTGLTISAGAAAATFGIHFQSTVSSVVVTWDSGGTNQNCPLIVSHAHPVELIETHIYGLTNPTAGNKTLKVTWNAVTVSLIMYGQSWTGADTTGGATTFNHTGAADGSSVTSSVTVTTTTSDAVVAVHSCAQAFSAISGTASFATTGLVSTGDGQVHGAGNFEVGGATATMTATNPNDNWSAVGTNIKAAAAAAGFVPSQTYFQQMLAA